jgi:hypothetical protein
MSKVTDPTTVLSSARIAVDQDTLGRQAAAVYNHGGIEIDLSGARDRARHAVRECPDMTSELQPQSHYSRG